MEKWAMTNSAHLKRPRLPTKIDSNKWKKQKTLAAEIPDTRTYGPLSDGDIVEVAIGEAEPINIESAVVAKQSRRGR